MDKATEIVLKVNFPKVFTVVYKINIDEKGRESIKYKREGSFLNHPQWILGMVVRLSNKLCVNSTRI